MNTWLLKKIREKYFVNYTISNKIKIVKKDYTDSYFIFGYDKESTYSLLYDEFRRSLLMQKEAKENWVKITKTQHSEQDLEK